MDEQQARRDRALDLLRRRGPSLRRTARRFSLCGDDADDALQRAVLILLTKAPAYPPQRLGAWMQLVTRREALAVRRERERALGGHAPERAASGAPSPAELHERREGARARARLLQRLKPQERRALVLRAEGYSYAEICSLTGWSYTKVNRCLAEGSARLRRLAASTR